MIRRKSAMVVLVICMMVLIVSPWMDASLDPMPTASPAVPEQVTSPPPEKMKAPSHLKAAAAMNASEFELLLEQTQMFMNAHAHITVELTRLDPSSAYTVVMEDARVEELPDVLLVRSEWVKELASSGYLLPANAAYVGKSLTEQFDAMISLVRWNDYLWGVPRDFDPYVLVWNDTLLHTLYENEEEPELPLLLEQWGAVAKPDAEQPKQFEYWLALDGADPLAMLAWLDTASRERSDTIWSLTEEALWEEESARLQALRLLDEYRSGVLFAQTFSGLEQSIADGHALAAIMPYSQARKMLKQADKDPSAGLKLRIDYRSWELPYVQVRSTSFVITAHTEAEEAARTWVAAMTDASSQKMNYEQFGRLPVYRSLVESSYDLFDLFPRRSAQTFPNLAAADADPHLPDRISKLAKLWSDFTAGSLTVSEWGQRWDEVYNKDN